MGQRVVHFEITADEPERAAAFYRDAFGWSIDKWDGPAEYWLVSTGDGEPGIDGAIMGRGDQPVINTVQVEGRLEDAIERLTEAGGTPRGDIMEIPGVGRMIYAADTEGNVLGVIEPAEG